MKFFDLKSAENKIKEGRVANPANPANQQPILDTNGSKISEISEISREILFENKNLTGMDRVAVPEQFGAANPIGEQSKETPSSRPYRLNINNQTQLVWLEAGLDKAEVLRQAREIYPNDTVTDTPPEHGWPRFQDISEVKRA